MNLPKVPKKLKLNPNIQNQNPISQNSNLNPKPKTVPQVAREAGPANTLNNLNNDQYSEMTFMKNNVVNDQTSNIQKSKHTKSKIGNDKLSMESGTKKISA